MSFPSHPARFSSRVLFFNISIPPDGPRGYTPAPTAWVPLLPYAWTRYWKDISRPAAALILHFSVGNCGGHGIKETWRGQTSDQSQEVEQYIASPGWIPLRFGIPSSRVDTITRDDEVLDNLGSRRI